MKLSILAAAHLVALWAPVGGLGGGPGGASQPPPRPQDQPGSIRGTVFDADFQVPLALAQILIVETLQQTTTGDEGAYVFGQVQPGTYTLVISKDGYVRQVRADVVVAPGRLTEVDAELAAEFTEMEEYVVQDLALDEGTELGLLELRFDSPALMDSISADLMSKAGASDAAGALRLVSGASVVDGKYAVIRGLPDRYVSSQMNGVRLPSADEDTRSVELDQFPAAVVESLQVTKTFTPDQQGDASGGAVDIRLRGIPEARVIEVKGQVGTNTQVFNEDGFVTYDGGGLDFWGSDADDREPQPVNQNWTGAAGVTKDEPPDIDYKGSVALGDKFALNDEVTLGLFGSFFYEHSSTHYDDGTDDRLWVDNPGEGLTPQTSQGAPDPTGSGDYRTSLFDVEQSTETVQWGGIASVGLETENHAFGLTFLHTHSADDQATLAEDTRGKEHYFPGYDPNDPNHPGNDPNNTHSAPYIRTETLEYTERTSNTLQLDGQHRFPIDESEGEHFTWLSPMLGWYVADSFAGQEQPDKRQFASIWIPPTLTDPSYYEPYKPSATFSLSNFQRIWETIDEDSLQYATDLTFPYRQWQGEEGYLKIGVFDDAVEREFDQDTYGNFGDQSTYFAGWSEFWSEAFPGQSHPILASTHDVDYEAEQDVEAFFGMLDLPVSSALSFVGGARFESTDISIVNSPEVDATWLPPGATQEVGLGPGEADVDFSSEDLLPSIGLIYEMSETVTLRASYAETIARQTFKELTPILQQEFFGGPVFVGNPDLELASLANYDVRMDYTPYQGGLLSLSWFNKEIEDPIEYVQVVSSFTFTTARNYPEGQLQGFEGEIRQDLGEFSDSLRGLSLGANATLIDSEVRLPPDEIAGFNVAAIAAPLESREMTNAPDHLYNFYTTLFLEDIEAELALFYTIQGDTLVAGAGVSNNQFVPSVFQEEYGTLNFSATKALGEGVKLRLQAKNLTDPEISEVYRSEHVPGGDVTRSSYHKGIEFTIGLSASF